MKRKSAAAASAGVPKGALAGGAMSAGQGPRVLRLIQMIPKAPTPPGRCGSKQRVEIILNLADSCSTCTPKGKFASVNL